MLRTKSQSNRLSGSAVEDFFKAFTLYGYGGQLGDVTRTNNIYLLSSFARRLHMKCKCNWSTTFKGEAL